MRTQRVLTVLTAGAMVLTTAACGAFGSQPETVSSGDAVVVGLPTGVTSFANSDIVIAKELGYFDDVGIKVEWKNLKSGVPVVQGVVGGALDIGASSIEPVVNAHNQGGGLKIIGSYADRLTARMVTPKSISAPTELEGKRLGIQEVGAFREIMTRTVLLRAGLTPDDVEYVPTDAQATMSAVIQGKVHSAILQPEQAYAAMREDSSLHELANMNTVLPDYFYGTFFASQEWLSENQDTANKFITAITRAHRFMYKNKAETVRIVSKTTEIDKNSVSRAYDEMLGKDAVFAVNDGLETSRIERTLDQMEKYDVIEGERPSVESLINREPVTTAVKKLGESKAAPR